MEKIRTAQSFPQRTDDTQQGHGTALSTLVSVFRARMGTVRETIASGSGGILPQTRPIALTVWLRRMLRFSTFPVSGIGGALNKRYPILRSAYGVIPSEGNTGDVKIIFYCQPPNHSYITIFKYPTRSFRKLLEEQPETARPVRVRLLDPGVL